MNILRKIYAGDDPQDVELRASVTSQGEDMSENRFTLDRSVQRNEHLSRIELRRGSQSLLAGEQEENWNCGPANEPVRRTSQPES